MTATLTPLTQPVLRRRINQMHLALMREGFDVETIQRMLFVRWMYQTGRLES